MKNQQTRLMLVPQSVSSTPVCNPGFTKYSHATHYDQPKESHHACADR
jgi:hypothetical protein